jgi:hypothetical protein
MTILERVNEDAAMPIFCQSVSQVDTISLRHMFFGLRMKIPSLLSMDDIL